MKITELQPDEFNIIQYIVNTTWPVAYGEILSKEQLDYMINWLYSLEKLNDDVEHGHNYYLAKDDQDQPLGFIDIMHHFENQPVSKLHKIYLLPETQGKGIGRLLIEKAEALARENGSEVLRLNVNRHNVAQHFYKKMGFEIAKSEDIDIGNGYLMEDYVMQKELE